MTKITKKDKRRLIIWLLLFLVMGSYLGVFTFDYWSKILINYKEKTELETKYNALLESESELNSEVVKLQDTDYVAKFAREKYMYSKEGELIIRIDE